MIRSASLSFWAATVPVRAALADSSWASWASRLEIVCDSADRPVTAERTEGGVSLKVSEIAWKLAASCLLSTESRVCPSPSSAWETSKGELVRLLGMVREGFWAASPSGSTARYLAPSRVRMSMAAVLALPTQAPRTRNPTFTCAPSRATEVTWPTLTPATLTSSPASSPEDSVK